MLYRALGRTGEQVSILGFGCMRLPVIGGIHDHIDVTLATEMLHYAFDRGVNYVDTAYPYHSTSSTEPGASESFVGRALAGGYRERVLLATKLPPRVVEVRADMDRILSGQLGRLRTDHVDCYLLHGLNAQSWQKLVGLGVLGFLDAARADGRIRFAGFSFHDEFAVFEQILNAYQWDLCQFQFNYMDVSYQAGLAGLRLATERELGVVVMEPLKGGLLAGRPPADIGALWDEAPVKRMPAEWALRYVWNHRGVSTALSGMGNMDQVVANAAAAEAGLPGSLGDSELSLIARVRDAFKRRTAVNCTACSYCLPCPSGINIPLVLHYLNNSLSYGNPDVEKAGYHFAVQFKITASASSCTGCRQCEDACPQRLPIAERVEEAARLLD